jgi:hypothetical protein
MKGKQLHLSLPRYQQLKGTDWPEYTQYIKDDSCVNEIRNFEYCFKHNIENIDLINDETHSQAHQSMFVIALTQGKTNGVWLEYGANHPVLGNNTYKLETELGWSGISVEIQTPTNEESILWQQRSRTCFVNDDALKYKLPTTPVRYDYLSMDIDSIEQVNLLEKITKTHRFSTITYETDWFRLDEESKIQTEESRRILRDQGYVLLVNGVTVFPGYGGTVDGRPINFEDWWVDPEVIDPEIIKAYQWITEDSLEIKKYWVDILFENDPHNLVKNDGREQPQNDKQLLENDYKKMSGPEWPTFQNFINGNFGNVPDFVANELQLFKEMNKL